MYKRQCRDLSGRRLRHVNDEIALERWHQARARNEARKRDGGGAAAEEDEDAPAHGIRGWHLAVPSWAELPTKARKSKAALRRAAAARRWQDEEADVLASGCVTRSFEGAVTMVDTVHDAFCVVGGDCYVPASANAKDDDDWAAAPLRVGDVLSVRAAHRPQGRNKWTAYRAERVSRAPPGKESYIKYCSLFNENYHEGGPVIVRPEEVGLTSVADEIGESVKIAMPILAFWISVSSAFVVYGQLTS